MERQKQRYYRSGIGSPLFFTAAGFTLAGAGVGVGLTAYISDAYLVIPPALIGVASSLILISINLPIVLSKYNELGKRCKRYEEKYEQLD
jgi:hypothetical protein